MHACTVSGMWIIDTKGGTVGLTHNKESLKSKQLDFHFCPFCGEQLNTSNRPSSTEDDYNKGFAKGLEQGITKGELQGFDRAYEKGCDVVYAEGHEGGVTAGFKAGIQEEKTPF